jgi:phage internal scaffolding protein
MIKRNRADFQIDCSDSNLVEQHHKDSCDIDNILAKYTSTGVITHGSTKTPRYGDFSGPSDYLEACLIVKQAEDSFMNLPSSIRSQFDNDPAKFMDFCMNPENKDDLVNMGLANAPETAPEPVQVVVVNQSENQPETPPPEKQ